MHASIDTSDFRTLIVIARTENLGQAAAVLGTTRDALSRVVSRLERQLEVKLFLRKNRRFIATDVGRLMVERAEVILAMLYDTALEMNAPEHTLQRFRVPATDVVRSH